MNNEINNALMASYPTAIDLKKTEAYKKFYDDLKKLRHDNLSDYDVFLYDKQAEESCLYDFKQDDKQSPVVFQRNFGNAEADVSVATPNRYMDVYTHVNSAGNKEYFIEVVEQVPNGILSVSFRQLKGAPLSGLIYMVPEADLNRFKEANGRNDIHPGYFVCRNHKLKVEPIVSCVEIGKELSENEIAQFVENLSSMKMSDIYDIVTNAYSHKKEQEIQEQNSSMKK